MIRVQTFVSSFGFYFSPRDWTDYDTILISILMNEYHHSDLFILSKALPAYVVLSRERSILLDAAFQVEWFVVVMVLPISHRFGSQHGPGSLVQI